MKNYKQDTMNAYWQISADYMQSIVDSGDRIDLHHIDPDLKENDPERYAQFLSADVVPMPQKQHLKLHKKGVHHKKQHNKRIGESVRETLNSRRLKGKIIKMTDAKGKVKYAANAVEAAKTLKCSKQLIYQVLSENPRFISFKTAKGCTLDLLTLDEFAKIIYKKGRKQ